MELIESYLDQNGPALSSEVAQYLSDNCGLNPAAARKRVSRAAGNIRRLSGIVFPHKARFLYLQQQFGSPWYWSRLADALIATGSAYGYAIAALRQRGGIIPTRQFSVVCGAPLKQRKHLSPESILLRLSEAKLLTSVTLPSVGECIALIQGDGRYEAIAESMRAQLITEEFLLIAIKDWLKKLGIVSYGQVATRYDEMLPKVGTFVWDLSAPSYLGHMVRKGMDGKLKPGFVVCDVHLGETMSVTGVAPFIRKCITLRSLHNIAPCMQMLVASRFDSDAFLRLKQNGIIPATPSSLFGDEISEGLSQLTSVLIGAAHSLINANQFDELFRKLGKIEGAANQLRGTLFEYLAADIARKTHAPEIVMNRIFKAKDKGEAEGDVVAVDQNKAITVIECKGYSPRATIPDALFLRWLEHSVPICFAAIKDHPDWKNLRVTFEFWTTAPLSNEAMAAFAVAQNKIRSTRYEIKLRLNTDIYAMCRSTSNPSLIAAFEKHYKKI